MFYPNARAIIERFKNGKVEVVIQRRVEKDRVCEYEFPGGKIEHCESFFDAANQLQEMLYIEGEYKAVAMLYVSENS